MPRPKRPQVPRTPVEDCFIRRIESEARMTYDDAVWLGNLKRRGAPIPLLRILRNIDFARIAYECATLHSSNPATE